MTEPVLPVPVPLAFDPDGSWLADTLGRFTYRPNVRLSIKTTAGYGGGSSLYSLYVNMAVEDTYHHGTTIDVVAQILIPLYAYRKRDPNEFGRWLQQALFRIEEHESREWLRFDGKVYDDPHASKGRF